MSNGEPEASAAALTLRFPHDGRTMELPAEEVGTRTSLHTGRELRHLRSEITVSEPDAVELRRLLEEPRADEDGLEWEGEVRTESFSEGGPRTLLIEWNERERLWAESLEFQGLELRPTEYDEVEQDGVVAVTFRATLSQEETRTLWALRESRRDPALRYYPVIRHGVTDEPRQMRLGRILWERDGDSYKHLISLVDESVDSQDPDAWLGMRAEPELGHLMAGLADLTGQFGALLDALQGGGVVDGAGVERIREQGLEARQAREFTFYQVDDLSSWQ